MLRATAVVAATTLLTLGMGVSDMASAHTPQSHVSHPHVSHLRASHQRAQADPAGSGPVLGASDPGTPYRWGRDSRNDAVHSVPSAVAGVAGKIVQLATSNAATYVLTSDGTVWAWGENEYGELGDGTTTSSFGTAVKVSFPTSVKISLLANPLPANSGLAIDSSGNAWGWGADFNNAMCMTGTNLLVPTEIPGLSKVTLAAGQSYHSTFDDNGTVVSCGDNHFGELGDGTENHAATPVDVLGLPRGVAVESLESSWHGTGALLADGDYYDWGYNKQGQAGVGTTQADVATAVKVDLEAPVVQVFRGGCDRNAAGHTLAMLNNGTVWAWGDGNHGQLGTGAKVDAALPVQVAVPKHVTFAEVVAGCAASFAIDSTGTLWSWGGAENGALGNGTVMGDVRKPRAISGGPYTYVSSSAFNVSAY